MSKGSDGVVFFLRCGYCLVWDVESPSVEKILDTKRNGVTYRWALRMLGDFDGRKCNPGF